TSPTSWCTTACIGRGAEGWCGSGGVTTSITTTRTTTAATALRPPCGTTSLAQGLADREPWPSRLDEAIPPLDPLCQRDVPPGHPGARGSGAVPVAVPGAPRPRCSGAAPARRARGHLARLQVVLHPRSGAGAIAARVSRPQGAHRPVRPLRLRGLPRRVRTTGANALGAARPPGTGGERGRLGDRAQDPHSGRRD